MNHAHSRAGLRVLIRFGIGARDGGICHVPSAARALLFLATPIAAPYMSTDVTDAPPAPTTDAELTAQVLSGELAPHSLETLLSSDLERP